MEPRALDHLLVLALALLIPLEARREYRRLLAAASPAARRQAWSKTILSQWVFAAGLIAWWVFAGRPLASLGLAPPYGLGFAIGTGLLLAAVGFLASQLAAVKRGGSALQQVRRQIAPVEALLPHDAAETRLFTAVAFTAGVCEELIYRGFLFWYLSHYGGTALAVSASSVLFGVAHLYQGFAGILKTGLVGLAMAGLRVLTGSLWLPMAVHFAVDAFGGWTAKAALEPAASPEAPAVTPAAP